MRPLVVYLNLDFRYMYQNYHNCARKSVIWMKETQPATSTASPESTPTTRRQLLNGARGAGVTAAAVPSRAASQQPFPVEIAIAPARERGALHRPVGTRTVTVAVCSRVRHQRGTARRSTRLSGPFAIGRLASRTGRRRGRSTRDDGEIREPARARTTSRTRATSESIDGVRRLTRRLGSNAGPESGRQTLRSRRET